MNTRRRPDPQEVRQALAAVRAASAEVTSAESQLRSVVEYAYSMGCQLGEIGEVLGISKQATFNRYHYAARAKP